MSDDPATSDAPSSRRSQGGENLQLGALLGRNYRLEQRIAEGRRGSFFKARALSNGRTYVVEVLRSEVRADPQAVQRILRAAWDIVRWADPSLDRSER